MPKNEQPVTELDRLRAMVKTAGRILKGNQKVQKLRQQAAARERDQDRFAAGKTSGTTDPSD